MQRTILGLIFITAIMAISLMQLSTSAYFTWFPKPHIGLPGEGGGPCYQVNITKGIALPVNEKTQTVEGSGIPISFWSNSGMVTASRSEEIITTNAGNRYNYVGFTDNDNNEYNPVFILTFGTQFLGSFGGFIQIGYGVNECQGIVACVAPFENGYHLIGIIDGCPVLNASIGQISSKTTYQIGFAYNETDEAMSFIWTNSSGEYSYLLTPLSGDGCSLSLSDQTYTILVGTTGQTINWYIGQFVFPDT